MKKEIVVYTPQVQLSVPDAEKLLHAHNGRIIGIPARLRGILLAMEDGDPIASTHLTPIDLQLVDRLQDDILHYFRSLPILKRYLSQIVQAYPAQEKYLFDITLDGGSTELPIRSAYVVQFHDKTEVLERFEALYQYIGIPTEIETAVENIYFMATDFVVSARAEFSVHTDAMTYVFTLKYLDEYTTPQKISFSYTPESRSTAHSLLLRLHPLLPIASVLTYYISDRITHRELEEILSAVGGDVSKIQEKSLQYMIDSYQDPAVALPERQQILDMINTTPSYQALFKQLKRSLPRLEHILARNAGETFCLLLLDKRCDMSSEHIIFLDYPHAMEVIETLNHFLCKRLDSDDFFRWPYIDCCITGKSIPGRAAIWLTVNFRSDQVDHRHTFTCMISFVQLFELMEVLCDTEQSLENNLSGDKDKI